MERETSALLGLDRAGLLRAVSDPDPGIRFWACRLLDHHELDAELAHRMVAALGDPNKKVRAAALHTLACAVCRPNGSECFPVDGRRREPVMREIAPFGCAGRPPPCSGGADPTSPGCGGELVKRIEPPPHGRPPRGWAGQDVAALSRMWS